MEVMFVLLLAQFFEIKTDKSVTHVHTVKLNKQKANLAARLEKCLDLSFLNVFSNILTSCLKTNS